MLVRYKPTKKMFVSGRGLVNNSKQFNIGKFKESERQLSHIAPSVVSDNHPKPMYSKPTGLSAASRAKLRVLGKGLKYL